MSHEEYDVPDAIFERADMYDESEMLREASAENKCLLAALQFDDLHVKNRKDGSSPVFDPTSIYRYSFRDESVSWGTSPKMTVYWPDYEHPPYALSLFHRLPRGSNGHDLQREAVTMYRLTSSTFEESIILEAALAKVHDIDPFQTEWGRYAEYVDS